MGWNYDIKIVTQCPPGKRQSWIIINTITSLQHLNDRQTLYLLTLFPVGAFINSGVNPYIYYKRNTVFKRELERLKFNLDVWWDSVLNRIRLKDIFKRSDWNICPDYNITVFICKHFNSSPFHIFSLVFQTRLLFLLFAQTREWKEKAGKTIFENNFFFWNNSKYYYFTSIYFIHTQNFQTWKNTKFQQIHFDKCKLWSL